MKTELFSNYKAYFKWRTVNGATIKISDIHIQEGFIIVRYTGDAEFFPIVKAPEEVQA